MAITTLDNIIANVLPPRFFYKYPGQSDGVGLGGTTWYSKGVPGAATACSAGLAGETCTSSTNGAIAFPSTVGGETIYLVNASLSAYAHGSYILCDRLWQNSGIVVTTSCRPGLLFESEFPRVSRNVEIEST